jgi:predicted dehydrogenase
MKKKNLSRRHSLKVSLAMAGASHLPLFSIGQPGASANSAANVAYIGVGGIAKGVLTQFPDDNHVALCDVDDREGIQNRERAPNAPMFKDYRRMLDKMEKDIDAVVISTPDHTHFTAAMEAIERGKHVFVQKPLAHDIWQVRTLEKAAAHHGVITQMGNQGHAGEGIRRLKEWYDAGICGEVREVVAWFTKLPNLGTGNPNWNKPPTFPPAKSTVPSELDWDLWLGPTRNRAYAEGYAPKGWRGWWELGNGVLGDMGCHALDAPCWILDLENPTSIESEDSEHHAEFVPASSKVVFQFPANGKRPPVKVTWYNGQVPPELEGFRNKGINVPQGNGVMLIGERNTLYANAWCGNPMVLLPGDEWMELRRNLPAKSIPRVKGGPHREWLNAVKDIGPMPGSQFEYSARLTEMILLGVLAQRAGQRIEWDGNRITNSSRFDSLLKTPPRKGWEYGEQYWKGGQT